MKRFLVYASAVLLCAGSFQSCKRKVQSDVEYQTISALPNNSEEGDEERDGYDEAAARDQFEFDQIKDPSLGYVPFERLVKAVNYTENLKQLRAGSRVQSALSWTERGPIYDNVGASGNSRGGTNRYTSGRTAAILIDTLNDASGNTVFVGGIAGGLWKCTNFLAATAPNWTAIDDRFDNLAISSITQDPSNSSILYFSTGEATSNADAVFGGGIYKSVNSGATWTKLTSSTGFLRGFKIVCDAVGNVFLANRNTTNPVSSASGLYRSKDQGATWENITPTALTSGNNICTDIEVSTTGKLHASFGYSNTSVQHVYTTDPANVSSATWLKSTGIRIDNTVIANRLELATQGDILYGVTTNSGNDADSIYKSIDGGATWVLQNTTALPNILSTQGWYCLTLAINPANAAQIVVGGLDAYKSTNSGATFPTRMTAWVNSSPYVHADHHFMQWWTVGAQSRMIIGSDGGIFLSNDGGATFTDRNTNLAIKQFYSGAIHPDAGSNYLLAGAQDNGVHQLTNAGKSFSTEVTGGDGCFVHINQQNAQVQFGSYVNNQYRRSVNGGTSWSSVTFSTTNGLFVNPFDYDDGQNIMYASWGVSATPNNQILVWKNANSGTSASLLTIAALARGSNSNATAFKVSPYTKDRLFVGSSRGKVVRLDNAPNAATVTDISSTSFPTGNISCVNVGSTDNNLVAVFSNYGVSNVWVSTDAGANWTAIDGDLPDMPVRWAAFDPQHDDRLFLATEAGVYYTNSINGASTAWTSDPSFPTVRTNMLKIRLSDNTIVAATHGRGLFTAVIPATPEIRFTSPFLTATEASTGTIDCRGYKDYAINVSQVAAAAGDATVTYSLQPSGTAIEGVDYDFTTNGDFTAPSKVHTFTSGTAVTKSVTVRIYDDAAIESEEMFKISFAVTGATNAYAGTDDSFQFNIADNDFSPTAIVAPSSYTLGSYTVNTSTANPFRSNIQRFRLQILIKASELTAIRSTGGDITSLTIRVATKNSTKPFTGFRISMTNTSATAINTGYVPEALTQVYTGDYSTVVGDNTFAFGTGAGSSSTFNWDGVSNIAVQFCFDNGSIPNDAAADVVEADLPFGSGTAAGNYGSIYSNATTGTGCTLNPATISTTRVNMKLDFVNAIESNLNASKNTYFGPNSNAPFYNTSGNIICWINNLGTSNFGCTQVTVDRAGTAVVPFWNNNAANQLMSKTYHVVPATNDAAGTYQATFYFTPAEKAGWEAATGNIWDNIKIVKVKSQVSNYTPANPAPDGVGTVEIVTPTFGTFGTGYTLTYTFTSGFSGFGFGVPGTNPLPVSLLTFTGKLENNTSQLEWGTSSEVDSRNFDIEKSIDGNNFYPIGTVAAAGNSLSIKNYLFRDGKLSPLNYYRLRINDKNGRNKLSQVVLIKYNASTQNMWITNNPFHEFIDVHFAKETAAVRLQLVNASGAIVSEKVVASSAGFIHWQITQIVGKGTYILRAITADQVFTTKLIRQ